MAGFRKIYTSENQYLEDIAKSTDLFDAEYYETAKEAGKDLEYLSIMASAKDDISSSFDRAKYDKLSGADRFNYFVAENLLDKSSDEYKNASAYFDQQLKQIQNQEIYNSLSDFEKAMNSIGGFVGNAFLQLGGIVEGLVDVGATAVGAVGGIFDEKFGKDVKNFVAGDATGYNAAQTAMNDWINKYTFIDKNIVTRAINDVATGIVRMTPMIIGGALAPVTGGVSAKIGTSIYYMSMAGNTAEQAIQANPDINYGSLLTYTGASVGLEALTEWASGKLFGDDVISSLMKGQKYAPTGSMIKNIAKNFGTEALEEAVSELFGSMLYKGLVDQTADVASIGDIFYAAVIGGLTGAVMTGGEILTTKRKSVSDGKLVDTSKLTKEQRKTAKNLNIRESWGLNNLLSQAQQALQTSDNVTQLMSKYGASLSDIQTKHGEEYQEAVKKDTETKTQQAEAILDLANLMSEIGVEQFQRSARLLNENIEEARTMTDNFLNHTDVINKIASDVFSKTFEGRIFTAKAQPTNSEQTLAKVLRETYPGLRVVFGDYGSRDGLAVRDVNVAGNYLFIKSNLVDSIGYNALLNQTIKAELAESVFNELSTFAPEDTDTLTKLLLNEDVKYIDLSDEQKRTLAQEICFDPLNNKRIFKASNKLHKQIFKNITTQADKVKRFGRKTEANKVKFRELLKIRNLFLNSVAETISSIEDVAAVQKEYDLSNEELKTKIIDKTITTVLNKNTQITNINCARDAIFKTEAIDELLENRTETDKSVNFDWDSLYIENYYNPEWVARIKNQQQTQDFEQALKAHLASMYNTTLDDRATFVTTIKENMSEKDVRKVAETILTKTFLDTNPTYEVLLDEVANSLYTMIAFDVDDNTDSIVTTDNQIKGTGKLKFFKGDVYERFNILGAERGRVSNKTTRGKVQREIRTNRTYTTQHIGDLDVAIQDENETSLEKYQKDIIRATKKAYGMNVKFFKNAPFNRFAMKVYNNVKGFISISRNTIYIRDDNTIAEEDIVTVVRHEIVHHLLNKIKKTDNTSYQQLLTDTNATLGDDWKRIRQKIENIYDGETSYTIDEETLVAVLNDEIALSKSVDEEALQSLQNRVFEKAEYNDPFVRPQKSQQTETDDLNRKLSNQQQEYFKNSVVRDTSGRLLRMYHGTPSGGFTIFNIDFSRYGLFGKGFYYTDNPAVGIRYSKTKRGNLRQVYEVYLNITHPIDMDAPGDYSEWSAAAPDADFPKTGTNEDFFRALEEYVTLEEMSKDDGADYILETLINMGYDGITHTGGKRISANDPYHRVYIAFYPEQIKSVYNTKPTTDEDIWLSKDLSEQISNETKNIELAANATTPQQIATAITSIVANSPIAYSESKGFDETDKEYTKVALSMIDENFSLFRKVNQKNYQEIRNEIAKSNQSYTDQVLIIFDRALFTYCEDGSRFDEATQEKIKNQARKKQTISAQWQGLQSRRLADKTSLTEIKNEFAEQGVDVSVSDDMVKQYVPEINNKKEFVKQIDENIAEIGRQIKNASDDLDKAALNKQLKDETVKRITIDKGTNEEILDWAITNEDIVTRAAKIQRDVFEQMVEKAELAEKTEGKKAITILVDEKTGRPKPFPKATQKIQKVVKRLKSFRMWAMLTSPVSWVRNWIGNAGMTVLDSATNQLEKWMTSRLPKVDLQKLESQQKALQSKKDLTPTEQAKLAELNAQIAQAYDFKFVETKASKELKKQIANDYKDVFQQILNGEDISKYEGSAEKASAIARAEREITKKSQNANFKQKVWAACQSMTDWGLNTGVFGDNAVVLNSLVKNFANMVESNKQYLIKSLTAEYGKNGRGMSDARKALVEKALKTENSIDIVNAMSKADVELFMDSCKQRTFEQYFKNSNWLSKWASNLSQKHPIAASLTSLVLPFPKVAANILSMAYKYSPLGFISAIRQWSVVKQMDVSDYKGPRDAFAKAKLIRTTSQATVGTIMTIAGLIFASLGFVDIDDDDYLGPSLKIGDLKISLSNLAPSMTTFSVGAAMMWAWKNDQSATLKALDVLYDNTLLGNIENVFRYGSPDKYIENMSINYFSQYVPAMLKLFAKIFTNQETIDKTGNYFERLFKTFASGIPFVSNSLPKKINPYTGEFLTGTGTKNIFFNLIESISPLDMRLDQKSNTQKEAERLHTESSGLSGTFKVNDKEYTIDKMTYGKYRADYIQNNFEQILLNKQKVTVEDENGRRITTTYDKLTDKQKKNALNRLYTEATSMTKIKWWTDQGNRYVVTDKDLYNEYRSLFDNKNIIYKKTWTKSKFVES